MELFENNVKEALKKMIEGIEREENEELVIGHISRNWHENEELRKEVEANFPENLKKAMDEYDIVIEGFVNETKLRNLLSEEFILRGYKISYEPGPSRKYKDIIVKKDNVSIVVHIENMINKLLFKGYDVKALINEVTINVEVSSHIKELIEMLKRNEKIDFVSYIPYMKEITFDNILI